MKKIIKNILLISSLALVALSCNKVVGGLASEISVNPETISFAGQNAADATVNVKSNGDWIAVAPEWLTVSPAYGTGDATVTISAADNMDTDNTLAAARTAVITFEVTDLQAELTVNQEGDPGKAPAVVKEYTIKEVLAFTDADKDKIIRVRGTISKISNPKYGEFTIVDGEGNSLLIYNTVASGSYAKFNPAVGDSVLLEGPFTIYKGTYELNKGTEILEIVRSLISVGGDIEVDHKGGTCSTIVSVKGDGLQVTIEYDGEESGWLSYIGTKPAEEEGSIELLFDAAEYTKIDGKREAKVSLKTIADDKEVNASFNVTQTGIPDTFEGIRILPDVLPEGYFKDEGNSYAESIVKVGDTEFTIFTVANYGDGIQMRKSAYLKNKTVIKNIKSIKLFYNPEKSFYPTNLEMKAGETVLEPVVDQTAKTAVYDFSAGTYTNFSLNNTSTYTVYLSKIEITLK